MANYNATGKKAAKGAELVQRSRAAVLNALDIVESEGETIGALLAKEFKANPMKFMELASKFCPKDLNIEANHTHRAADLTDDELADIAAGSSKRASQAPASETNVH